MRPITVVALAGILGLAACSAAATPPPSATPVGPTSDEQFLLVGVRLDLQTTCAPLRVELPPAALAGLECRPTSDVVERVAIYLFNSQQALLDSYLARLVTHEVTTRTNGGRCLDQVSEGAYTPGDGGSTLIAERGGCYLDSTGNAHYAATQTPFVLIELDGRVGDIAAVERWAWLGNQDTPGAPTIWRSSGPASPEK